MVIVSIVVFWGLKFSYLIYSLAVRYSIRIKATKNMNKILQEVEELKSEYMRITELDRNIVIN